MELHYVSGSLAYLQLLEDLLKRADAHSPRGQATREICHVTVFINDPHEVHVLCTERRPSAAIAATEAAHLIAGTSSLAQLDAASGGRFTQFAHNGRLRGAYGPRAATRLEELTQLLTKDPDTRQAVASIWRGDESAAHQDVPCTLSYQFLLRDDALELRTSMRSNDVILGAPFDLEVASVLQRTMASALGVAPGRYVHTVGSLHLYERDVPRAEKILNAGLTEPNRAPAPQFYPLEPFDSTAPERWQQLRTAAAAAVLADSPTGYAVNDWYFRHVPRLPAISSGWDICANCRYVIKRPEGCPECNV